MRIRASNLRSLMGKLQARLSKLHSTCTREQVEKKLMLEKKVYCFITFEFQSKYVRSFCESTARWSKLHSTSTDDPSEKEEQISWITHNFFFLRNWSSKLRTFSASFMHGCQNCILHVRRNNSRKIWCCGVKFTVFLTSDFSSNYVGVLAKKFRHGGHISVSLQRMIIPGKNNSLE